MSSVKRGAEIITISQKLSQSDPLSQLCEGLLKNAVDVLYNVLASKNFLENKDCILICLEQPEV